MREERLSRIIEKSNVRKIRDKIGRPVDQKIEAVVATLNIRGVKTLASCEGHMDHGSCHPWVAVAQNSEKKVLNLLRLWHSSHNDEDKLWCLIPGSEFSNIMPIKTDRSIDVMQSECREMAIVWMLDV